MRIDHALLCAGLIAGTGCEPLAVVGEERRQTITTAVPGPDGRWRQAGFRGAASDDEATADAWYGLADAAGQLVRHQTVDATQNADSIRASVVLGDQWVLAGFTTDADGLRSAWVRSVGPDDAEVWTVKIGGAAGVETEATAISVTNIGTLLVGGIERLADGSTDGWVAQLAADGGVLWRRAFATDFQRQTTGMRVWAIGSKALPASPSKRQFWVAGERVRAGVTAAGAVELTLDGEVWNSGELGLDGRIVAVFADRADDLAYCALLGGRPVVAHTLPWELTNPAIIPLTDDPTAQLAGCALTGTQVLATGTVERDGVSTPFFATYERTTRQVTSFTAHPTERGVRVSGVTPGNDGTAAIYGRRDALLRRWSASSSGFVTP
ncbi:MAG: hypothetical protein JNG84_12475 [Archangium sp.]|nr:hypothetical protein [Archangium sp.]